MNRLRELIDHYRYYIMGISALIMLLLGVGLLMQRSGGTHSSTTDSFEQLASSTSMSTPTTESAPSQTSNFESIANGHHNQLVVDIKGGIKSPGVYQMLENQRVADLVEAAGGFSATADRKNVNLARKLIDQQVVYIPVKGEINENLHLNSARDNQGPTVNSDNSISHSNDNNDKININTADKERLQTISGIGEKKADNIISYRQQHGDFKSIDEIKNADGIGDKMFENIKNQITI